MGPCDFSDIDFHTHVTKFIGLKQHLFHSEWSKEFQCIYISMRSIRWSWDKLIYSWKANVWISFSVIFSTLRYVRTLTQNLLDCIQLSSYYADAHMDKPLEWDNGRYVNRSNREKVMWPRNQFKYTHHLKRTHIVRTTYFLHVYCCYYSFSLSQSLALRRCTFVVMRCLSVRLIDSDWNASLSDRSSVAFIAIYRSL